MYLSSFTEQARGIVKCPRGCIMFNKTRVCISAMYCPLWSWRFTNNNRLVSWSCSSYHQVVLVPQAIHLTLPWKALCGHKSLLNEEKTHESAEICCTQKWVLVGAWWDFLVLVEIPAGLVSIIEVHKVTKKIESASDFHSRTTFHSFLGVTDLCVAITYK